MPEDIGNLENLRFLHAQGNCFTKLPKSFEKLTNLEEVLLSKNSNISYVHVMSPYIFMIYMSVRKIYAGSVQE